MNHIWVTLNCIDTFKCSSLRSRKYSLKNTLKYPYGIYLPVFVIVILPTTFIHNVLIYGMLQLVSSKCIIYLFYITQVIIIQLGLPSRVCDRTRLANPWSFSYPNQVVRGLGWPVSYATVVSVLAKIHTHTGTQTGTDIKPGGICQHKREHTLVELH